MDEMASVRRARKNIAGLVSINRASQTVIISACVVEYERFFVLPGGFLPAGGRRRLKYENSRTIREIWQPIPCRNCGLMVWYGMENVDLYSAIITTVCNALNTPVSGEKPGFQALSKGLIVLLCAEVVRQGVPTMDHVRNAPTLVAFRQELKTVLFRECFPVD